MKFPRFRISRGGWKQERGEYGWINSQNLALAVFITPSFKKILDTFGENIISLRGSGMKNETKSDKIDIGGFDFLKVKKGSCKIHYDFHKNGKLDKSTIIQIKNLLDNYGLEDCSIDYLKIEISDENLKDSINDFFNGKIDFKVETSKFIAELKLEKCESNIDKEKWDDEDYNYKTLLPIGFKKSMLHCIRLIDEGQYYRLKKFGKKFYYINWEPGKRSVNIADLQSPIEIVSALKSNLQPYGLVKNYKIDKQNKLVLTGIS
jgi:hypothetical protein